MDFAYLPPLPVGLISAAVRDLAFRASQFVASAHPRSPGWAGAAVFAVVGGAWLMNSIDWGVGGCVVAVCLGSLVATAALAAGWSSEPDKVERWAVRALVAAVGSALPALIAT